MGDVENVQAAQVQALTEIQEALALKPSSTVDAAEAAAPDEHDYLKLLRLDLQNQLDTGKAYVIAAWGNPSYTKGMPEKEYQQTMEAILFVYTAWKMAHDDAFWTRLDELIDA